MMTTRRRDDRGATAVLFALLAVVLIGVGALAVDIGHAYAKRSLLQTDVDVAVMAATAELTSGDACNPEVVAKATEFLEKAENAVPGQYDVDLSGSADDQDGFITCSNWRVNLWAPKSHVEYGLGQLLSEDDGLDVQAHAAAQVKAANGGATLPFFAVQGCDSGPQSIRNDSGGPSTEPVPNLVPNSTTNNNASFTISPTRAPAGTTSMSITLTGSGFKGVDGVGFTGAGGPPYHYVVPVSPPATASTTSITVSVPSEVLAVEDVWFVRVSSTDNQGNKAWSSTSGAQRFTVGEEKLYCDDSTEGNFGTIDLPRTDTNSFPLEWNMIKGIEPKLDPHPAPNGECSGDPDSVESKTAPVDGTNCVATEPGLKVAATNDGLVLGKGGLDGRLDIDSTSNCSRTGSSSRTPGAIHGKHINDDVLSCFIVNGASLADLVDGTPVGTQALSADIFQSPRFFWLPVLDTDPSTGKKSWPIVDFRPGFITDQALSATRDAPGTISAFNGLEAEPAGIREVKVLLFDELALPEFAPATGEEEDYTGSGRKAIVLVE
ncbi:MAG: pilus assembly protein [Actinomycetota bacterium]|nr:pilus assembly protein [Actinomycetota bacterium]